LARFRLRFLLQEFDLSGTEVLIGRSSDCQVTIEDPLVSRRHARIRLTEEQALVVDLGSRNGVRVNGTAIQGEKPLEDGDRIRIGTQELVFFVVKEVGRQTRATGFMKVCSQCGTPFPQESPQCPHCGAESTAEEDTISGLMVEPRRSWTFQLLGEVIERALGSGRSIEAERLMRRAARELDERLGTGDRLEAGDTELVAHYATRLSGLVNNPEWVSWALGLYRIHETVPSAALIGEFEKVNFSKLEGANAALDAFAHWWREGVGKGVLPEAELKRFSGLITH